MKISELVGVIALKKHPIHFGWVAVDTKPARELLYTQQADYAGSFSIARISNSNPRFSFELTVVRSIVETLPAIFAAPETGSSR